MVECSHISKRTCVPDPFGPEIQIPQAEMPFIPYPVDQCLADPLSCECFRIKKSECTFIPGFFQAVFEVGGFIGLAVSE